jgi:hypothetical protein
MGGDIRGDGQVIRIVMLYICLVSVRRDAFTGL